MEPTAIIVIGLAALLFGFISGYGVRWLISLSRRNSMEISVKQTLLGAKTEAQKIIDDANKRAEELKKNTEDACEGREQELRQLEERLHNKEDLLDRRQIEIADELKRAKEKSTLLTQKEQAAKEHLTKLQKALEHAAKLDEDAAKALLLKEIETAHEEDIAAHLQKIKREGKQRIDREARALLASAIQRQATLESQTLLTTPITLPSEDTKGKIIGKEGRNVRAFERMAGVDLVIDETPLTVSVSSFDPVRRHIARVALERLIEDGRIHPARIEEVIENVKKETKDLIYKKGEEAAFEIGAFNLDEQLISLLGRLHFRTSYGQNVLTHSLEMAHIGAILAEELGADVQTVKLGALLHDIGKAVDHEIAGTHVEIGRRLLRKFGINEEVIKAMQSHHEEYPYETIESVIVQTADAISAGRPGARRDTAPQYVKRLADLEAIANEQEGITDAFAVQAGRELRIFVDPEHISDVSAQKIAREVALRIESELAYPGEIKIVVIREQRTIEFAR